MNEIVEKREIENNVVNVTGEVVSLPEFSHEVFGEGFYIVDLSVARMSQTPDVFHVMISERLTNIDDIRIGGIYEINGQLRSFNKHEENSNHLLLTVFARELRKIDSEEFIANNFVKLDGYLCKKPVYRKTPLGREIADVLLAVNRPYGKSDYIPCICWGRNARWMESEQVGARVEMIGRFQSREYVKKIDEEESEKRIAYEVSVSRVNFVEHE